MGTVSEVFKIILSADAKGAIREFKRAEQAAEATIAKTTESGQLSARQKFAAMSTGAKAAVGAAAGAIAVGIGKATLDAAADLETAMRRVDATFQSSASSVQDFAESAASIGVAKDAALQGSAVFGELLTQLGLSRSEASRTAPELVKISAGFAAMNSADPSAVIQAVAAAFRGEYDALQRYLPAINDQIIRQKAVALGYAKTEKAVDEYGKAQAALQIILDKGSRATDFLAEVQDTAAFRAKVLQAEFRNLAASLGTQFLPIVNSVLGALTTLAKFPPIDIVINYKIGEKDGKGGIGFLSGLKDIWDYTWEQAKVWGIPGTGWDTEIANAMSEVGFANVREELDELRMATEALNAAASAAEAEEYAKWLKETVDGLAQTSAAARSVADANMERTFKQAADAAEKFADAQEKAADAAEDAADAIVAVADAERTLLDRQRALADAEQRVADAREDATQIIKEQRDAIEDLAAAQRSAARDVERAEIALRDAERATREEGNSNTMAEYLDVLDRKRLAELDLEDARERQAQVGRDADRDQVDSTRDLESAQRRLADALSGLEDAKVDEFNASISLAEEKSRAAALALAALAAEAGVAASQRQSENARRVAEQALVTPEERARGNGDVYIEAYNNFITAQDPTAVASEIDRRFGAAVAGTGNPRTRTAV